MDCIWLYRQEEEHFTGPSHKNPIRFNNELESKEDRSARRADCRKRLVLHELLPILELVNRRTLVTTTQAFHDEKFCLPTMKLSRQRCDDVVKNNMLSFTFLRKRTA